MIRRQAPLPIVLLAWAVFIAAVAWPTIALIARCFDQGRAPTDGYVPSGRQLGLLWRSLWMSGVATGLCLLLSLPTALAVGRKSRSAYRDLSAGLLLAVLLCPPMVYAFGWARILPATFSGEWRCILVWVLWAWPIPAAVIGAGWARLGRAPYESAVLDAGAVKAILHVVVPSLLPHGALAGLLVFALLFSDYGVPHACGLIVFTTELLGWADSSSVVLDTAWPAVLPALITGIALAAVALLWRRCAVDTGEEGAGDAPDRGSDVLVLVTIALVLVSWLLPIGTLVYKLGAVQPMIEAFRTYGKDLAWSLGTAFAAGLVAVGMGIGIAASRSYDRLPGATRGAAPPLAGLGWAVVFGALPGALIGVALVAAYNHEASAWVYDRWLIVVVSYVSRFGWIGLAVGFMLTRGTGSELADQARTDGASEWHVWTRLILPMQWPLLACAVSVVAALSVADVTASSIVRVPAFSPIAHVIIEKFHRFEDGMLISLSLWLIAAGLPAVGFLMVTLKRWSRR